MNNHLFSARIALFSLLLAWALLLICSPENSQASSRDESSCVVCHLDEEMLEENVAEVQVKKSPLQAGVG